MRAPGPTYVECPRDAWQGLPHVIPTEVKAGHLQSLLDAGFTHLDLGSFVSPRAVPQMADTEQVLAGLTPPEGADLICIVGNVRGVERAAAAGRVTSVGYPLSVNETFQRRNVGRSLEESWRDLSEMQALCAEAGLGLVVYVSMAFGNPYRETWGPRMTAEAIQRLRDAGVARIALADTVGTADDKLVDRVLSSVSNANDLGLHLHSRPDAWRPLLEVGLRRGVRWVEGALGGVGGCPFAGDDLVGNLPTEEVLPWLAERDVRPLDVDPDRLAALAAEARALATRFG
ncbi:MAG TPA: hydroxymethylglutaryl-CoA lyase [Trueperaceae bacterium]|nr:hydroxymethylglutaryl-CoA lyase [Trueperaceae bacterium]